MQIRHLHSQRLVDQAFPLLITGWNVHHAPRLRAPFPMYFGWPFCNGNKRVVVIGLIWPAPLNMKYRLCEVVVAPARMILVPIFFSISVQNLHHEFFWASIGDISGTQNMSIASNWASPWTRAVGVQRSRHVSVCSNATRIGAPTLGTRSS